MNLETLMDTISACKSVGPITVKAELSPRTFERLRLALPSSDRLTTIASLTGIPLHIVEAMPDDRVRLTKNDGTTEYLDV